MKSNGEKSALQSSRLAVCLADRASGETSISAVDSHGPNNAGGCLPLNFESKFSIDKFEYPEFGRNFEGGGVVFVRVPKRCLQAGDSSPNPDCKQLQQLANCTGGRQRHSNRSPAFGVFMK